MRAILILLILLAGISTSSAQIAWRPYQACVPLSAYSHDWMGDCWFIRKGTGFCLDAPRKWMRNDRNVLVCHVPNNSRVRPDYELRRKQ